MSKRPFTAQEQRSSDETIKSEIVAGLNYKKKNADKQAMEDNKSDIGWGSQIRSYVLDDSRIKDLRRSVENRNTQAVLDGDLDRFIEAVKSWLVKISCLPLFTREGGAKRRKGSFR